MTQLQEHNFNEMDNQVIHNPFISNTKVCESPTPEKTSPEADDPLAPLKKGMLMSTFRKQSPSPSLGGPEVGGPDQSFIKAEGIYAAARRGRNRTSNNSVIEAINLNPITSPMSSICESYKNVDFFEIKEPYHVVKSKHYRGPKQNQQQQQYPKRGSMVNI